MTLKKMWIDKEVQMLNLELNIKSCEIIVKCKMRQWK